MIEDKEEIDITRRIVYKDWEEVPISNENKKKGLRGNSDLEWKEKETKERGRRYPKMVTGFHCQK